MKYLNTLRLADALDLMRLLPSSSVDFICTDPPYYTTQLAFDKGKKIDWSAWWKEANRVLKPAGMVCLFASSVSTFEMYATNPRNWRYNLIWEKTRYSRFLDANRRPLQGHEDILVFCRKPNQATYNPQKTKSDVPPRLYSPRRANRVAHYSGVGESRYNDTGDRHPHTVLKFGGGDNAKYINKTQKPVDLIRWLIRSYTNPGDIVLDTCAGSATTAIACIDEHRNYICCDNDPAQIQLSTHRIKTHAALPKDLTLDLRY